MYRCEIEISYTCMYFLVLHVQRHTLKLWLYACTHTTSMHFVKEKIVIVIEAIYRQMGC